MCKVPLPILGPSFQLTRRPIPGRNRVIPAANRCWGCMPTPVVIRAWRCGLIRRPIRGCDRVIHGWGQGRAPIPARTRDWGRAPIPARTRGWGCGPILAVIRGRRLGLARPPIPGCDLVRGQDCLTLRARIRGRGRALMPSLIRGSGLAPARDRVPGRTRGWTRHRE